MPDVRAHFVTGGGEVLARCANINDVKVRVAMLNENTLAPSVVVVNAAGLEFEHDYVVPPADVTVMIRDLTYDCDLYRHAFVMHASAMDVAGCDRAMAAFLADPVPVVGMASPRLDLEKSVAPPDSASVRRRPHAPDVDAIDFTREAFHLAGSALIHYVDRCGPQSRKDVVKLLLEVGADVRCKNADHHNILMRAIEYNLAGIVELVLESSAKVNDTDREGRTPLAWAASKGYTEVAAILLDADAAVDAKDLCERTPLYSAAMNGRTAVVQMLTDASADVCAKDAEVSSALHAAAMCGHSDVARVLLGAACEPEEADASQRTPLTYAVMFGHCEVVRLLLDAAASPEGAHKGKRTSLHIAAMSGHADVVRVLLDARADAAAECSRHWSPLRWATERGHCEAASILASHLECA